GCDLLSTLTARATHTSIVITSAWIAMFTTLTPPPTKSCRNMSPSRTHASSQTITLDRPCRDVRFGSKADICGAATHVCLTPDSDHESGHVPTVMSALPPKADMCGATRDVRFGPKADSCSAAKTVRYSITSSAREIRVETWRLDFAARAGR